ncbi:MAG: adenylate kinase family protein [Candidatus Nanohaloarchaea archaeon]
MIVALTGTPGTGKTSVAERLDYEVLDLTEFVKERSLGEQGDEFEVDIDAMVNELEDYLKDKDDVVIEGHLSHHFPSDYCVVLRCDPDELEERLSERDYSSEKIRENIESEILDSILIEAVDMQKNVLEVDTTGRDSEEVAKDIEAAINEGKTGYGEIDWTSRL